MDQGELPKRLSITIAIVDSSRTVTIVSSYAGREAARVLGGELSRLDIAVVFPDTETWLSAGERRDQLNLIISRGQLCIIVVVRDDEPAMAGTSATDNIFYELGYIQGRVPDVRTVLVVDDRIPSLPAPLKATDHMYFSQDDEGSLFPIALTLSDYLPPRSQHRRWQSISRLSNVPMQDALLSLILIIVALVVVNGPFSHDTAATVSVVLFLGATELVYLGQRYSSRRTQDQIEQVRTDTRSQLEKQRVLLAANLERLGTFAQPLASLASRDDRQQVGQKRLDSSDLLSELAHALGTPLGQITAAARTLLEREHAPEKDDLLVSITESVHVCSALLTGFRHVASSIPISGVDGYPSLADALTALGGVYNATSANGTMVEVKLEHSDFGYPTEYMLAVLLPLIDNGVEASVSGSLVVIEQKEEHDRLTFVVSSTPCTLPPEDIEMYEAGVSTKAGHDGLGLATVRRLLSIYREAEVKHVVDGARIHFSVSLPQGDDGGRPRR